MTGILKRVSRLSTVIKQSLSAFPLDYAYFINSFSWISIAQLVNSLLALLVGIAFGHLATQTLYGHYNYVQSLFFTLGFFGITGMGNALVRALAQDRNESFLNGILVTLTTSVGGSIVMAILGNYILDPVFRIPIYLLLVLFPFYQCSTYPFVYFSSKKRFKYGALFNLVSSSFSSIVILFLLLTGVYELWSLLLAYFLPQTLVGLIMLVYIVKKNNFSFSYPLINSDISFAFHLSGIELLPLVTSHLDKLLIGVLLPPHLLGIYAFALTIPDMVTAYLKNIVHISIPKLAVISMKDYKKNSPYYLGLLLALVIFVIIGYFLFGSWLFPILFPRYALSLPLSLVYSLSLITIPTYIFSSFFTAQQDTRKILLINLVYFGLQVIIILPFVMLWGIWGAVWGKVLVRVLGSLFMGYLFYK